MGNFREEYTIMAESRRGGVEGWWKGATAQGQEEFLRVRGWVWSVL